MNEQKLKNVEQWLEALQELARTAEKALANDTPPGKAPPSLDERSRNLGAAIHKIRELVRPEPKTVAFLEEETWYQMKGAAKPAGEYRTPKAESDAIMANPPMGEIGPAADAPSAASEEREWYQFLDIPELGIQWRRYYSRTFERYIAAWHNDNDSHVYEVAIYQQGQGLKWVAEATNDGGLVFSLASASKAVARRSGLAAMRAYIIRGHRRTWRKVRAEAKAAECEAPLPSTNYHLPTAEEAQS